MSAPHRLNPGDAMPKIDTMRPNPGHCPTEARDKRVIVELRNGRICGRDPVTTVTPAGWAADGKNGCRWSLTRSEWDIAFYEVLR